jgi:hypothetical protein
MLLGWHITIIQAFWRVTIADQLDFRLVGMPLAGFEKCG